MGDIMKLLGHLSTNLCAAGLIIIAVLSVPVPAQEGNSGMPVPFSRGFNLTGWFELWSPGTGNLNDYNRSDMEHIKALGADIVRLPVHFDNLSSGTPDYIINRLTWKYLDKAVGWAEELHLYLVIDNHAFNTPGVVPSAGELENYLAKIWPQIAARYKGRSRYILYEIQNEPNYIDAAEWNKIKEHTIEIIRKYDMIHTIVVSGCDYNSVEQLAKMPVYHGDNLIYTFHFFLPIRVLRG
jgi:endoglucanase